jgi:hypothetical protein
MAAAEGVHHQQQQQHDMGMATVEGGARFGAPPPPLYGGTSGGLMGMHHHLPIPGMGMPHPSHLHHHQGYNPDASSKPVGTNTNMMQEQPLGFGPRMSSNMTATRSDANNNLHSSRPLDFGMMARNNTSHQQHNAINPSAAAAPQSYSLPENSLRTSMPGGDNLGTTTSPSAFDGHSELAGGGLWNNAPKYQGLPQAAPASEGFYNMARPPQTNMDRQRGATSMPLGFDVGVGGGETNAAAAAPFSSMDQTPNVLAGASGRDNSRLIDSLFGDQQGASSLLTGFNGLSVNAGDGLGGGAGLWATSTLSSDWDSRNKERAGDLNSSSNKKDTSSVLFAGLFPPPPPQDHQHPAQSRFNWSSTNALEGSDDHHFPNYQN